MSDRITIADLRAEIENALSKVDADFLPRNLGALVYLAPQPGMRVRVSLRHAENNRNIKSTANCLNWTPESGEIVLTYEKIVADASSERHADFDSESAPEAMEWDSLFRDVVVALDAAERDPRFRDFVGFKPFRDQFLPARRYCWGEKQQSRQQVLAQAIQENLILTGKVPNPKSPENPTTSIRLNHAHPMVKETLRSTQSQRSRFHPVPIQGESLSATVLAERR